MRAAVSQIKRELMQAQVERRMIRGFRTASPRLRQELTAIVNKDD